ncbi:MAG: metal ABC transporter ATP-binding protein [Bacteroidaceae bacterium]|nr:metal ABC transporter ATP-binding protein [Bacteroidaceae bacterium]
MPSLDKNIIVSLSDVSLSYEQRQVLQHVDLTVGARDFVVITGANGGGKTTLLRLLLKLIKPTTGVVKYYQSGAEVDALHIGYLPQKNMIDSRFPVTLEEVVASGLYTSSLPLSKTEKRNKVEQLLALIGLEGFAHRPIGELSGGGLQRTLLARAIISQPQLLVLDEPLSYIDETFAPRIYEMLAQLAQDCAIVMVTHQPDKVAGLATRILKIANQSLLE